MPRGGPRSYGPAISRREALLFEAGIKLGGVFHQYIGIPVTGRTAPSLARTIEDAVRLQPYVRTVRVRIVPARGGPSGRGRFAYRYLTAEMLRVDVELVDGPACVRARLEYRADLRYPLMVVLSATEGVPTRTRTRPRRLTRGAQSVRRRGRSARRTGRSVG